MSEQSPELSLNPVEMEQYSRHLKLPGFGMEKQLRLKNARVLLVGAGGLGCPMGLYLAAAGVGTIGVVDFDRVDRSNLQRQVAHTVSDIGLPKVESLIVTLKDINPLLNYQAHDRRLDEHNIGDLITQYDLILDGSDNFGTRFLLADACYLHRVPLLQGAVYEYEAQLSLFIPGEGPCYRCIFREPPQQALASCAEVGVLGVVPGTAGLMMATEAIKFLTGLPSSIHGKLLVYDALMQETRKLTLAQDWDCPLCGEHPTITEVKETQVSCSLQTDQNDFELTASQAKQWLNNGVFLLDVREAFEFRAGHLAGAFHLSLGQIQMGSKEGLPTPDQPMLVYCQKGMRSLEAVRLLRGHGYLKAHSLSGGLVAWDGDLVTPV